MPGQFTPVWPEIPVGEDESLRMLRMDIRASSEETWRLMRTLHEEVIERLKLLGGQP